jgi:hypothetical protein
MATKRKAPPVPVRAADRGFTNRSEGKIARSFFFEAHKEHHVVARARHRFGAALFRR